MLMTVIVTEQRLDAVRAQQRMRHEGTRQPTQ